MGETVEEQSASDGKTEARGGEFPIAANPRGG
jgi:hypothetical protein